MGNLEVINYFVDDIMALLNLAVSNISR